MTSQNWLSSVVPVVFAGSRLDQTLPALFPDYSRTRLKGWTLQGCVTVDGSVVKLARQTLWGGELVTLTPMMYECAPCWQAEPLQLKVVYEDANLLVLNKPRGQVVHPGAGNHNGTLLNALLHHAPELEKLPRAGIIHRLDKDTAGLMVVAKSEAARTSLVAALQGRSIVREYQAMVSGVMVAGGTVSQPIGRHPHRRTQMAVHPMGRPATTHYRVVERFRAHSLLQLRLESGRTHQIRVHMAHMRYPLVGDPLYGVGPRPPKGASSELLEALRSFNVQALCATHLRLLHPISGVELQWHLPLPEDMVILRQILRDDLQQSGVG